MGANCAPQQATAGASALCLTDVCKTDCESSYGCCTSSDESLTTRGKHIIMEDVTQRGPYIVVPASKKGAGMQGHVMPMDAGGLAASHRAARMAAERGMDKVRSTGPPPPGCPGGALQVRLLAGHDLPPPNGSGSLDRYITVKVDSKEFRTSNVKDLRKPFWLSGNYFRFKLAQGMDVALTLTVMDKSGRVTVARGTACVHLHAVHSYSWARQAASLQEGGTLEFESRFQQYEELASGWVDKTAAIQAALVTGGPGLVGANADKDKLAGTGSLTVKGVRSAGPPRVSQRASHVSSDSDGSNSDSEAIAESNGDPDADGVIEGLSEVEMQLEMEMEKGNLDTALLLASMCGDAKRVGKLLDSGAVPDAWDDNGLPPLYFAVTSGVLGCVKQFLIRDMHEEFSASFFDWLWRNDNKTLLMLALFHGHHEIYEYLLFTKGCTLQLLSADPADHVGVGSGGVNLDKWLAFLPEINGTHVMPKPQTMKIKGRRYTTQVGFSEKDIAEARRNRYRARDFVRNWHQKEREKKGAAEAADAAEEQAPASLPSARGNKRMALTGAPKVQFALASSKKASAQEYDATASNILSRGDDEYSWACGACSNACTSTVVGEKAICRCSSCGRSNFVDTSEAKEAGDGAEDDASDDGENWVNAGMEFANEKVVKSLLPLCKRSPIWFIGGQKVRELLRVANVVKVRRDERLFEEAEAIKALLLLKEGEVLLRNDTETDKISRNGYQPMALLDPFAYLVKHGKKVGRHSVTAVVNSKEASICTFPRHVVAEFTGWGTLEELVRCAIATGVINTIGLFRASLSNVEQQVFTGILEHEQVGQRTVLCRPGQKFECITIVQRGSLRVTGMQSGSDVSRTRFINIVGYLDEVKRKGEEGDKSLPNYIVGLRQVAFDGASEETVEVVGKYAHVWRLYPNRVIEGMFTEPVALRRVLEVAILTKFICQSVLFKGLRGSDPRVRQMILDSRTLDYWEEQDIVSEGETGSSAFWLLDGTVAIIVKGREVVRLSSDITQDRIRSFGELGLLQHSGRREATIRAASASCTVAWVTKSVIDRAFGSVDSLLAEQGHDAASALSMLRQALGIKRSLDMIDDEMVMERAPSKHANLTLILEETKKQQDADLWEEDAARMSRRATRKARKAASGSVAKRAKRD